jgi:hypothetical protein
MLYLPSNLLVSYLTTLCPPRIPISNMIFIDLFRQMSKIHSLAGAFVLQLEQLLSLHLLSDRWAFI